LGTEVKIALPKATPPVWFLPNLNITPGAIIGVLDDDPSVHHLWKNRLGTDVTLLHFHNGGEFRVAVESGQGFSLLLIDFELIGENETGLDLIREFALQSRSVLVTSRFEDEKVRLECEELKIRLLPKMLVSQVPLAVSGDKTLVGAELVDAIFLDDDSLNHMTWQYDAKAAGVKVHYYSHVDEFFEKILNYPKCVPIFVDFNLEGQELNGLQVCERLREHGFRSLFLASGMEFDDLPMWLPNVGKDFPFSRAQNGALSFSPSMFA
jgi:CheY-like chemotaxis protein